ncbi:MAG TPA: sugar ABC transporter permease [Candidatus Dormibacteraeota bacterium]|nr:sugar ABC transporter permease [Candidatus Dormibacteraeota bacterium]
MAGAFLAPTIVLLVAIAGFPLAYNLYNSFLHLVLTEPGTERFVGLANYRQLVASGDFLQPFIRTSFFTLVSVALEFVAGLGLALIMHRRFWGRGLVRAAVLVPWAVPTVVSGMLWKNMFDPGSGFVDWGLGALHLPGATTAWLNGVWTSWTVILVADAWKNTPFLALILLAGLQVIPDDLYEQARIDGAGVLRRFRHVTLPMLKPAVLVALIFRTLSAFLIFDVIYVITGGGPGSATETLSYVNWRAFLVETNFGYGGAISVALTLIALLIALVYMRVLRLET